MLLLQHYCDNFLLTSSTVSHFVDMTFHSLMADYNINRPVELMR